MFIYILVGVALVQTVGGLLQGNNHPATTSSPDGTALHQTLGLLVVELDKRVVELDKRVVELDKRVVELDKRVVELDKRVVELDKRVVELDKRVVELDKRVVELDKGVNDLQNKVAAMESERHQYVEKTTQLEQALSTERLRVESLQQVLDGHDVSLASILSENSLQKNATMLLNSTVSSLLFEHEDLRSNFEYMKSKWFSL